MKEIDRAVSGVSWWSFKRILVICVVIGGLVFVGRIVLFPLFVANEVVDSAKGVVEKTLDSDNVLYNYEWFKQTYQDVKALDGKIANSQAVVDRFNQDAGPRSDWKFQDREEYSRLNTIVLGLRNQRQDVVATYNARSKMANRAIFKGGELPETLQ